jgi:serine/threonine protein kinase
MALPADTQREELLDQVLADYLRGLRDGSAPSRAELLARYPDLAEDLRSFFADQDRFNRLAAPLRGVVPLAARVHRPRDFGPYELQDEIARGGMGVVFRAWQKKLHRPVALKLLLAGPLAAPDELQRFRTEAEAVAALEHPHIVPVYDVGTHEGQPYLCMKLVEGGSLSRLRDRYRDQPRAAASLLRTLAEALHFTHQRGILHRDLKPSNILLEGDPNGPLEKLRPYVSDFGLARRNAPSPAPDTPQQSQGVVIDRTAPLPVLTMTGAILGTPGYLAPEQATGRRGGVTVATDVYGLGAILYELLTGKPPFTGPTPLDALRQVLDEPPAAPRRVNPACPRDLETICHKCLSKEPAQRYASAQELADDLGRYLRGEPIRARAVGPLGRLWRWAGRQPVIAGLTLALFLSLAVGLGLVTWFWRQSEDNYAKAQEHANRIQDLLEITRQHEQEAKQRGDRIQKLLEITKDQEQKTRELAAEAEEGFRTAHEIVGDFCVRIGDAMQEVPGLQPRGKELLEKALRYYQTFEKKRAGDPGLRLQLADVHARIGRINLALGHKSEAVAAYTQALAIYRAFHQREPDNPE